MLKFIYAKLKTIERNTICVSHSSSSSSVCVCVYLVASKEVGTARRNTYFFLSIFKASYFTFTEKKLKI